MSFLNWMIIRSGFTQNKGGGENNGCIKILGELGQKYGGNGNRIELEAWHDSPGHTAEYIYHLSDDVPNIALVGYSWGCGYGTIQLAHKLDLLGIDVNYMVLCDPVIHSWAIWRSLIPRTLFSNLTIKIPPNVHEVFWLRQHENKPCGHDLIAQGRYTVIHSPIVLKRRHQDMDNAPEFLNLCRDIAELMFVNG